MSSFYPDELSRMKVFRELLHGYGITLHSSPIGSTKCTTDGHLMSTDGDFNEIGSGGAEPFAQAMLYYRKILKESNAEIEKFRSVLPCIHIIVFGACIGFAGSVFIEKVQCDVLAPIIPLFWHSTDLRMQVMAARTFGALKIANEKLTNLYSLPTTSLKLKGPPLGCPYPQNYTNSTGHIQEFSYDETRILRDRLIFFGETVGNVAGNKICIKFVKHYSPEAHEFCASKGNAPKLIAYNSLHGGWKMEAITSLIEELHNAGYIPISFVGDDNQFMLFDFDWAGLIEEARYPMYVNRTDIRRPEGARDGQKILAKHDLEMLKYLFPEQDGREPAAKRPRLSTGEGS
ncbi:hypothetical protein F4604DRAFT_1770428 [Suillus subluteus]|nr:hypothetical protein F4604DRAFT_1770428 [Suillus subluteus]